MHPPTPPIHFILSPLASRVTLHNVRCLTLRARGAPVTRSSVYRAASNITRQMIVLNAMWHSRPDYNNAA